MAKVILFSGHMIDGPGRASARFPAERESAAGRAIGDALERWQVGPGDLGICGAARGGDILFAEQCLAMGAGMHLFLPLPKEEFLEASVRLPPGLDADWEGRFDRLLGLAQVHWPEVVSGEGATEQVFVANNARMLGFATSSAAPAQPHVLLLWDGLSPDGKGGTAEIARATTAAPHRIILDPARLG